jgi:polyisoprenoid-binding protein YceI
MRAWIIAFTLLAGACTTAQGAADQPPPFTGAAPQTPPATAVSELPAYPTSVDLPAGAYRIDPRHATVTFRIRHMGLAWLTARFDAEAGELTLDPEDPSRSRLTASVDANSVNTGVVNRDGERAFDRQIARALGAARTQQITFASTSIERTGAHTARVNGELTMNGQTHPATLDVTFDGAAVDPLRGGQTVLGFSAHGQIDRSQWGVTEWSAFTGSEVQIVIESEFVKAS